MSKSLYQGSRKKTALSAALYYVVLYQKINKQYITVDNSSILLYTVYQEEDTYEDYNQQFINGTYI